MSASAALNGCLVTYYFAEKSSSDYFYASLSTTLGDLRDQIHTKVKSMLEEKWGERNAIHVNSSSILISGNTYGSKKFTDDSLTVGDLCTAGDHIYAIIPSKPSVDLPIDLAALCPEFLTQPLFDKAANSKRILISTIETLKKERNERAIENLGQDKRMEEIMAKVKDMIDESTQSERLKAEKRLKEELARGLKEERAKADEKLACELAKAGEKLACELEKADEKLACELAKADEKLACELEKADKKLAGELAKANKKIDKLQSNLNSSNDRVDEMSYKLQEVDAMTMDTVEWISLGDTALLDRIKLRNLLNIAQENLALSCQLTDTRTGASLVWRDRLGYTQDFATRLVTAHNLLRQEHVQLDDRARRFLDSPEGMRLVVEKASDIREQGDRVAHQTPPTRKIYNGALTRFDNEGTKAIGMMAIADFVCI